MIHCAGQLRFARRHPLRNNSKTNVRCSFLQFGQNNDLIAFPELAEHPLERGDVLAWSTYGHFELIEVPL